MPPRTTAERFEHRQSHQLLGERITELAAHIDAAQYRFLVLLERFDHEGGATRFGMAGAGESPRGAGLARVA